MRRATKQIIVKWFNQVTSVGKGFRITLYAQESNVEPTYDRQNILLIEEKLELG